MAATVTGRLSVAGSNMNSTASRAAATAPVRAPTRALRRT